jgi:hypothetical protein
LNTAEGLETLCYMLAHEAHHPCEILLAHQMEFPADESDVRALEFEKALERVRSKRAAPEMSLRE